MNKYGFDNFIFEEIDHSESQNKLDEKERYWISYYQSDNKTYGYNLDSGGRGGGAKSNDTKRKIGLTTIEKWKNPETAKKMRDGLLKGAETMKKRKERYIFICPVCGKKCYYMKYEANKKKYCSNKCASLGGAWEKGIDKAAKLTHERNLHRKSVIKKDVIEWILNNADVISDCPYNKITPTLNGLTELLTEKYDIKDLRSIFICFDVKNLKALLDKFKEITNIPKENVR